MIEYNTNTRCPSCGSKNLILETTKETYDHTIHIHNTFKCMSCGSGYASIPYKIEVKEN